MRRAENCSRSLESKKLLQVVGFIAFPVDTKAGLGQVLAIGLRPGATLQTC